MNISRIREGLELEKNAPYFSFRPRIVFWNESSNYLKRWRLAWRTLRLLKQQMDGLIRNFSEFLWIDFLGLHLLEKLFYAMWCGFYSQMKILNSKLVAFTYMVLYHFKFNLLAITVSVKTENINDSFNATCYTRWEETVLCHDRLANWDNVNNDESGNGQFFILFSLSWGNLKSLPSLCWIYPNLDFCVPKFVWSQVSTYLAHLFFVRWKKVPTPYITPGGFREICWNKYFEFLIGSGGLKTGVQLVYKCCHCTGICSIC